VAVVASRPIRCLLVDDHPLFREGTRALLERTPGMAVVGVADDGAGGLRQAEQLQPDVVLLDVGLPDMSGVDVAQELKRRLPSVEVVLLTGYNANTYARMVSQLGVRGVVHKTAPGATLVAAINACAEGRDVLAEQASSPEARLVETLTPREHQVLELIAAGLRNAEVAATLQVSLNTIEFHVRHILGKLGVRSRTEAVARARALGYAVKD
jgi:two-component system, NarL family, nitrate/nitrite response regulator NarL